MTVSSGLWLDMALLPVEAARVRREASVYTDDVVLARSVASSVGLADDGNAAALQLEEATTRTVALADLLSLKFDQMLALEDGQIAAFASLMNRADVAALFAILLGDPSGWTTGEPALDDNGQWIDRSGDPLFPSGVPSIDDINQGSLGDCWFLTFLGGMAESDPTKIDKMIEKIGDDTYIVHLATGDQVVTTNVRQNGGSALWVNVLEKAVAQELGSYDDLDGGYVGDATRWFYDDADKEDFDPVEETDFWDAISPGKQVGQEETFTKIQESLAADGVVAVDHYGDEPFGGNHSLSVVDAFEEETTVGGDTKKVQKITIRNPWGSNGDQATQDKIKAAGGSLSGDLSYIVFDLDDFEEFADRVWITTP